MKTREKILEAALQLFNTDGTAAVSTNHIAEALGMSPGNLYYHFRNKEEIIRALFEQQFARSDTIFDLPADRPATLADLERLVRANFAMLWDFRFMYRELIALLRRDEQLKQRWVAIRARGFAGFHELFDSFVAAGVLRRPAEQAEVERLAELCWLLSEFWLANVEVSGQEVSPAHLEHGITLLLQLLAPFIVHKAASPAAYAT